jgi:hypothetical protein
MYWEWRENGPFVTQKAHLSNVNIKLTAMALWQRKYWGLDWSPAFRQHITNIAETQVLLHHQHGWGQKTAVYCDGYKLSPYLEETVLGLDSFHPIIAYEIIQLLGLPIPSAAITGDQYAFLNNHPQRRRFLKSDHATYFLASPDRQAITKSFKWNKAYHGYIGCTIAECFPEHYEDTSHPLKKDTT